MKLGFVMTLTAVALLSGCSIPAAPSAVSSLSGLYGPPESANTGATVEIGQQLTLGILYSQNTQINRAYLEHYQANAGTGFGQSLLVPAIRDAYIATSNPDLAVDWVKSALQRRFGTVTVYPDVEALKAAKPDVTVVIDTHSQLITPRSSDIESTTTAYFYDKHLNYIATATGRDAASLTPVWAGNKRSEDIVRDITQQQNVQMNALHNFDRSLNDVLSR